MSRGYLNLVPVFGKSVYGCTWVPRVLNLVLNLVPGTKFSDSSTKFRNSSILNSNLVTRVLNLVTRDTAIGKQVLEYSGVNTWVLVPSKSKSKIEYFLLNRVLNLVLFI